MPIIREWNAPDVMEVLDRAAHEAHRWVPQPADKIWAALKDTDEVYDEDYTMPAEGATMRFALLAGAPRDRRNIPDAEPLEFCDAPNPGQVPTSNHIGPARYEVLGRLVQYKPDGFRVPNIWQPVRNAVVDIGVLVFAQLAFDRAARSRGNLEWVKGLTDLRIDYAEVGTPEPMIYEWEIVKTLAFLPRVADIGLPPGINPNSIIDEQSPDLVYARLRDTPPCRDPAVTR